MSWYFGGKNGRLSRTWRFRRSGKSAKTLEDLKNLGDLQFRRSVGTGTIAVLPGKFLKSLLNRT